MSAQPKRIWILGCSGSGKSTLARSLAEQLDLPAVHLDQLFWQPGWQESDTAGFQHRVAQATTGEGWIADGGYITALGESLFPQTDHFIQFDLPRWLCLWRIARRIATSYGQVRPDMAEGCPERFDNDFVRYIWTYNKKVKPRIDALLQTRKPHQGLTIIRSQSDLEQLIAQFNPKVPHA